MIEKIAVLGLFPFYLSMRVLGVVTHDTLELLEEIGLR